MKIPNKINLYDTFIYRVSDTKSLILNVDENNVPNLIRFIQKDRQRNIIFEIDIQLDKNKRYNINRLKQMCKDLSQFDSIQPVTVERILNTLKDKKAMLVYNIEPKLIEKTNFYNTLKNIRNMGYSAIIKPI